MRRALRAFISYRHADVDLQRKLHAHLASLRHQGLVEFWDDRQLLAGTEFDHRIVAQLESSDLILLLISADYFDSTYCRQTEMPRALERHDAGLALVVPIILRPCEWKSWPIARLRVLPAGDRAVTQWDDTDQAFATIAHELRRLVERLHAARLMRSLPVGAMVGAIEICALATRMTGGVADTAVGADVIRSAIGKSITHHWKACAGRRPIEGELLQVFRRCWLKSVVATTIGFQSRPGPVPERVVSDWIQAIRDGAGEEASVLDKSSDFDEAGLLLDWNLGAIGSADFVASREELNQLLVDELFEELGVLGESPGLGEPVFIARARQSLQGSASAGTAYPEPVRCMFSEIRAVDRDDSACLADLLAAYVADALDKSRAARTAFENQILRHVVLREGSISHKAFRQALKELAHRVTRPFEPLTRSALESVPVPRDSTPEPAPSVRATEIVERLRGSAEFEAFSRKVRELGPAEQTLFIPDSNLGHLLELWRSLVSAGDPGDAELDLSSHEQTILQGYLEWIVREFRYLPNELRLGREAIALPLDRVFVSVRGYPGTVSEMQGHGQASGRSPATLRERDFRKHFSAQAARSVDLAGALSSAPALVILGDPGSGKTTLGRWLALNFARAMQAPHADEVIVSMSCVNASAEGADEPVSLGPLRLPIFLRAADLAKAFTSSGESLADLLASGRFTSRPTYPHGHARRDQPIETEALGRLLKRYVSARRAVVLLDGLDEVSSVEERRQVVSLIHAFVDQFFDGARDGNRLVVTSRLVGYEANPLRNAIARYTIEPMDKAAIGLYCRSWHAAWAEALTGQTPEEQGERSERASANLLAQVFADDTSSLPELASNPFMLGLLCALNLEGGERLPPSRAELYGALIQRELSGSWISREAGRERLRDAVSGLFAFVALWIHRSSATGVVDGQALRQAVREIAREEPSFKDIAGSLDDLASDAGLLVERGFRQYAFRHLTIQEYLAAVALVSDRSQASERIWEHCGDSRWHEVTLFALGLLEHAAAPVSLTEVCMALLAREDGEEGRAPGVTFLLASAMAQIPAFPVEVGTCVLERLFDRYAAVSASGRPTAFGETVEKIFARELGLRSSGRRRDAARHLLVARLTSHTLEQRQGAATLVSRSIEPDRRLLETLAKAARSDRSHGNWRIRWALVRLLSNELTIPASLSAADRRACEALAESTLTTLRDPTKIRGSRYFAGSAVRPARATVMADECFPLKQCLLADDGLRSFVRASPGWTRMVIALHGGLCHLGIEDVEEDKLRGRVGFGSPRGSEAAGAAAAFLDGNVEPKFELLRAVPLDIDPRRIWRCTPLSAWLVGLAEEGASEDQAAARLLALWRQPESAECRGLITDFASTWFPRDAAAFAAARGMLRVDVLLALTVLGQPTDEASLQVGVESDVREMLQVELEWLDAYLDEPTYRATLVVQRSLSANDTANRVPANVDGPPAATRSAIEAAFPERVALDYTTEFAHSAGGLLWRFFESPTDEQVRSRVNELTRAQALAGLAALSTPPGVPWRSEEGRSCWVAPCLSPLQSSSEALAVLLGIERIPATEMFSGVRSLCLHLAGEKYGSNRSLLPLAIHLTKGWEPSGDLFRSALQPWLEADAPGTDEAWSALRQRRVDTGDDVDPVSSFWVLRVIGPEGAVARRDWLTALYGLAARIEEPLARLGAELHVFTLCDVDETAPQWRRMMRLAQSLEPDMQRDAWIARLRSLQGFAVQRSLPEMTATGRSDRSSALANLIALTGQRPITVDVGLGVFDEDRAGALALCWANLLWNLSDDPVYSCAVVLDTRGKNLAASMDDLLVSLALLQERIGLPGQHPGSSLVLHGSKERGRELMASALTAVSRLPAPLDMLREWLLRRLLPYLRRLDGEFIPWAIAVASRLKDASRQPLLRLLCPSSNGELEVARDWAWTALPSIPDPYLRWRTEWVLGSHSGLRRSLPDMLADVAKIVEPAERRACMALVLMDGQTQPTGDEAWGHLLDGLPAPFASSLEALRDARFEVDPGSEREAGDADPRRAQIDSVLTWIAAWRADHGADSELAAASVIDLRLRVMRYQLFERSASETVDLVQVFASGRSIADSAIRRDALTGLRFLPLAAPAVEPMRSLMGPDRGPGGACPLLPQLLRGADAMSTPFLHEHVETRADIWGDWAALMLAEQGTWRRRIVARVRGLLRGTDAVLRNRALLAFARGGGAPGLTQDIELLSAARLGVDVIEEMAMTLTRPERFHPVVDMTMIFALDRVVFDDSEQVRGWLDNVGRSGMVQRRSRAVLESICRASLQVCRLLAASMASAAPAGREALIRAGVCLWERQNWREDRSVWEQMRNGLFDIGSTDDVANANDALVALGHVGAREFTPRLMDLAHRDPTKKPSVLRCLGILAENGHGLGEAETKFIFGSLESKDPGIWIAAAEAMLRTGRPPVLLEQFASERQVLCAFVARLDSYFVGEGTIQKAREAGEWLSFVTDVERGTGALLEQTTFASLLQGIADAIATQPFTHAHGIPPYERLSRMMPVAAAAAELMPETCEMLLNLPAFSLDEGLSEVACRHGSYEARKAALVLLSLRRRFSAQFARALECAMADLSIIQTTALETVARLEYVDEAGLGELERMVRSPDTLVAYGAARAIERIAAAQAIEVDLRAKFELKAAKALQGALAIVEDPKVVLTVDSDLDNWTYRLRFHGLLKDAREAALLSLQFPAGRGSRATSDGVEQERVELTISAQRRRGPIDQRLTFGAHASAGNHPAMHQAAWLSATGASIPSDVMGALEEVGKLHRELGVSFAQLLHLAVQSRFQSTQEVSS